MVDGQFVVLSIYEVHMASACLMIDGHVVAATHEERFSRVKNDCGFPLQAAQFCMREAGVSAAQIDKVALVNTGFYPASVANILFKRMALFSIDEWIEENHLYWKPKLVENRDPGSYFDLLGGWPRVAEGHHYDLKRLNMHDSADVVKDTFNELRAEVVQQKLGIDQRKVCFMPHYMCHHYHAYYSGKQRGGQVVVVHAEGAGEDYNQAVSIQTQQGLKVIAGTNQCDLGRLYQWMTLLLGMKPYHHEYKVMGLAPYATKQEVEKSLKVFANIFKLDRDALIVHYREKPSDLFFYFQKKLQGHRFDGIAGALQQMLETHLCQWIEAVVAKTRRSHVVYGGGVAMNVKANLNIAKLDQVANLFVPLSPADESNVFGAAYWLTERHYLSQSRDPDTIPPLSTAYLGAQYTKTDVEAALSSAREKGYQVDDQVTSHDVAKLLAAGKVVARCHGRSEFGQRALGNRSILANVNERNLVSKINQQIKYRDFWMPFAPTLLAEDAHRYLINNKQLISPYMTQAFDTQPETREDIINGVHSGDWTTRAQLLSREQNPGYYDFINEVKRRTGVSAVLNTSFNLHGEPIVESPADAVSVFERSSLDALWLEDCLLMR